MGFDFELLEGAIEKQRLLFMAIVGLNTPAIGCRLRDDEIGALTGCVSETIETIHQAGYLDSETIETIRQAGNLDSLKQLPYNVLVDADLLEKAIEKQRLLFLAIVGLNTPAIGCRLRDDEIGALTGCVSETIKTIRQAADAVRL